MQGKEVNAGSKHKSISYEKKDSNETPLKESYASWLHMLRTLVSLLTGILLGYG